MRDITERRKAEEKLTAALEEKEVLLREVHHRVKNNLQAMIYLIEMQSAQIKSESTRQFLRELQEQARAMSLVYEQLYQSDNLAQVAMRPYLQQLAVGVVQAIAPEREIQLELKLAPVSLDVSLAMPCGLIVNELITNTIKYAFPASFEGDRKLLISLKASSCSVEGRALAGASNARISGSSAFAGVPSGSAARLRSRASTRPW